MPEALASEQARICYVSMELKVGTRPDSKCPGRLGLNCLGDFRFNPARANPPAASKWGAFLLRSNVSCISVQSCQHIA